MLCFLPIGAYATTLPRWLDVEIGIGPSTIGALMAAMSFVAVIARPLSGRFSDLRGRRVAALGGAVMSAIGALLLYVPAAPGVVWAARGAVGLGEALVTTACMAWIVDMIPAERRGRALSWFGVSFWFGISIGPQTGALARELGGFDAVWALAALCSVAAAILFMATPDSIVRAAPGRIGFSVPRAVWIPGAAMGLVVCGEGVLVAFGVQHLVEAGVRDGGGIGGAASVYSVLGVTALASRPFIAPLPDRFGGRACALAAIVVITGGLAALAAAGGFALAAVGAGLMGVGLALINPALLLLVTAGIEPEKRGVAVGSFMSFIDIGIAAGAVVGGLLVAGASTAAAFWAAAVAATLGAVLIASRAPTRAQEHAARAA